MLRNMQQGTKFSARTECPDRVVFNHSNSRRVNSHRVTSEHRYRRRGTQKNGRETMSPARWVACGLLIGEPIFACLICELYFVRNQTQPSSAAKRLHSIVDMQLVVNIRQMEIHRALADKQRLGHFFT